MKKQVLIVEDDLVLAMVNAHYLKILGYEVAGSVTSGQEAIAFVQQHCPDLILMDVKIDGPIDGIETVVQLRAWCQAPVIYVTGNSELSIRSRAMKTGFRDFLVKPISLEMLGETLEKVFN